MQSKLFTPDRSTESSSYLTICGRDTTRLLVLPFATQQCVTASEISAARRQTGLRDLDLEPKIRISDFLRLMPAGHNSVFGRGDEQKDATGDIGM
jgi:hypothetical protein